MTKETPSPMLALARQLEAATNTPGQLPPPSDALHSRLLAATRNLLTSLETPESQLMHLAKAPVAHGVLRAALRIRLFERFDEGPPSAPDLAQRCGIDVALLVRLMRTLAAIGIFTEPSPGVYAHTLQSQSLRQPQHRAVIQGMAETATLMTALPDFLGTHKWQNPVDAQPTLFGFAHQTDQTMFEWLESQPEQRAIFAAFQSSTAALAVCQLQPFLRSLLSAPSEDSSNDRTREAMLVDVGGGRGAVLRQVSDELDPPPRGRIVLQDLPQVLEGVDGGDRIEVMPYNFLQSQPVHGARTYLFRHIFHNWSDGVVATILQNTVAAMAPSSRLVIVDLVLPDGGGASPYAAFLDVSMMAFGGMERTEAQWRGILGRAGLQVRRIEPLDALTPGSDQVIEAVLA
ncbi:S-adenosyl-L-methionine-dependent methyltransferase [Aspergillus fijiensis CBS 313.89]|uniref:S-adenosyl-L-methionine-dependent methyltransferase n=1 Tax=Aspergillus fijiensis CBS 313.89 TaxID=1448319 RepID=A0A8G1RMQ4_9EURO|nr:S-adenosyl-L-methionine-dependent methyltransferase [Aspergillus fijiensis CBS 313.89]RAK76912.1 S-adenosyl-L-methionine-dependent methyltransferase [Aspergillus fijiensis CBS 313.89]